MHMSVSQFEYMFATNELRIVSLKGYLMNIYGKKITVSNTGAKQRCAVETRLSALSDGATTGHLIQECKATTNVWTGSDWMTGREDGW